MQTASSRLLIYIPTFNRVSALAQQLSRLQPQITGRTPLSVRLLISDNASSDSAGMDMLERQYSSSNISFIRNYSNIGGNANIAQGFVHVKENEFLWILSDNDLVSTEAIACILPHLDYRNDVVALVDQVIQPKLLQVHPGENEWPIPFAIGLISCGIFNANSIKESAEAAFMFHNSSFPHLAVVLHSLSTRGILSVCLVAKNSVIDKELSHGIRKGDYTMSRLGMPLLFELLPYHQAKRLAWSWFFKRWWGLHACKSKIPFLYRHAISTLKYLCGPSLLLILPLTKLLFFSASPLIKHEPEIRRLVSRYPYLYNALKRFSPQ